MHLNAVARAISTFPNPARYGLSRFLPSAALPDASPVHTPFKDDFSKQLFARETEGLENQKYCCARIQEVAALWSYLAYPATTTQAVRERQEILRVLVENPVQHEFLNRARSKAYHAAGRIEELLEASHGEKEHADRERRRARCRIEELLDHGLPSREEEIQAKARELRMRVGEQSQQTSYEEKCKHSTIVELAMVSETKRELLEFAHALAALPHPVWREIAGEYELLVNCLPTVSAEILVLAVKNKQASDLSKLSDAYGEEFQNVMALRCGLILAADMIVANHFVMPTLRTDIPEHFTRAWNILKEKGPRNDYQLRNAPAQVLNDSPAPLSEIYLAGSNMSGKSFGLDTWFYLRSWGQTFGYIPAESGNLHVAKGMTFLHRLGSDINVSGRSSFQTEILKGWCPSLSKLGGGDVAYLDLSSDEAFSTTSPVDQYRLLIGVVKYLRSRNVRVVMATHNGAFLEFKSAQPDVGIYHYAVDLSNGRIKYTYRLTPGLDTSHALEVARRMNVPPHIIDHARKFTTGAPPDLNPTVKNPWKLDCYTESERARMKQEALSFRFFWPSRSEAVLSQSAWDAKPQLVWGTEPGERSHEGSSEPYLKSGRPYLFVAATTDQMMSPRHIDFHEDQPSRNRAMSSAGNLLHAGPSAMGGVKEILERQKMFDELLEGDRLTRLLTLSEEANTFLWRLHHVTRPEIRSFPKTLLGELAADIPTSWCRKNSSRAKIFFEAISFLEANAEVKFESKVQQYCREKMRRLLPLIALEDELYKERDEGMQASELLKRHYHLKCALGVTGGAAEAFHTLAYCFAKQSEEALAHLSLSDFIHLKDRPHALQVLVGEAGKDGYDVGNGFARLHITLSLFSSEAPIQQMLDALRSMDSVYLHAFSNYLESIAAPTVGVDTSGVKILNLLLKNSRAKGWAIAHDLGEESVHILRTELAKLEDILFFADELKRGPYSRVTFNDEGRCTIKEPSLPASGRNKKATVTNDTILDGETRCELLESPNGSGKSFYLRERTWTVLYALATGYAPAKEVNIPPFSGVAYLDRVPSDLDQNLSAFGNEITQWLRLPIHFGVTPESGWFLAIDEAFSSTDPHAQAALSDAVLSELINNGNIVIFSSHNHDWARSFANRSGSRVTTSHFAVTVKDNEINYNFQKQSGAASSYGLEVAHAFGLPDEIIKTARAAPDVRFV